MGRREDLLRRESEAWEHIDGLVSGLGPQDQSRSGLTPDGWSVIELMWHVAAWCRDATRVLGEMRAGTWDGRDPSLEPGWTDRVNREEIERSRAMDLEEVRAAWPRERARMLAAFGALEEVTPQAEEWFEEAGATHYAAHLGDLEGWVGRLRSAG